MTPPPKGNEEILSDPKGFMAAYDRARESFSRIPGVQGVGFGQKNIGGKFTDNVAIIVFVAEKKDEADLPPEELIPPEFEGYRVDVRKVIEMKPGGCDNDTAYSTIKGGIQISVGTGAAIGTLGCIVKRRSDSGRENVYLLTNRHVLTAGASLGDYVYHPYAPSPSSGSSGSSRASTALGPSMSGALFDNLQSSVPDPGGPNVIMTFFVDAGIARIDIDSKCWGSTCTKDVIEHDETIVDLALHGVDTISDVRSIARDPTIVVPQGSPAGTGPFVYKVGRTTGKTRGVVRTVAASVSYPAIALLNTPAIVGQNVIEIQFDTTSTPNGLTCKNRAWFAEEGDSGSLVVDENGRAIGLLSGVPDPANPAMPPDASSAACHILPVLDLLGISIATSGGTSHGSTHATDGSGVLTMEAPAEGDPAGPGIAFAREGLRGPLAAPADPVELTDAEQARLFLLREAFRENEKGRELHAVFAEVRREIGYLVRNCRRVTVTWAQSQGPAFFALTLNHLRGAGDEVPLTINGVERMQMLEQMAAVLIARGSPPLARAVERYRHELIPILGSARTVDEAIARINGDAQDEGQALPLDVGIGAR